MKLAICIILTATITGCATSSDPRKGGLFGGLNGISSGAYDSRIQQRKVDLRRQEIINQDLKEKSETLGNEANAWEAKLTSEQQRLDDLDENLISLESDVNNLIARTAKQKTEIAKFKLKIEDQRRRIKSRKSALKTADPDRYRVLQQERNRLADEYKKLQEYFIALSNAAK
jgi:chromosome segregation ATPase